MSRHRPRRKPFTSSGSSLNPGILHSLYLGFGRYACLPTSEAHSGPAAFLLLPTADLSRKFSLLPSAIVPETEAVNALHALTCLHFPIRAVLPEDTLLSFPWSGAQLALMVPRTEFLTSYEFTKVNELILVLLKVISNKDA